MGQPFGYEGCARVLEFRLLHVIEFANEGLNIATSWGSFAFFGPLTILTNLWGAGITQQLIGATIDKFNQRDVSD